MKKRLLIGLMVIVLAGILCSCELAESDEMVYASNGQREKIYNLAQNDPELSEILNFCEVSIVKQTIAPLYTVDILEYARTGDFELVRTYVYNEGGERAEYQDVYIAKTMTKTGEFGGNIRIYVVNGRVDWVRYEPSLAVENYPSDAMRLQEGLKKERYEFASCSYADHAARIQNILGKEDFVSPLDVKLVVIEGGARFFYVESERVLIPVGALSEEAEENVQDSIVTLEELKEKSDEVLESYNKALAEKAEWEEAHPGEEYRASLYLGIQFPYCKVGQLDNVDDVGKHFDIDMTTIPQENSIVFLLGCGIACVVLLALITGFCYRKYATKT